MNHQRLTQDQLAERLTQAAACVTVGAHYQHYKGQNYTVLLVALREEDSEPCVVYRAEYGVHAVFIRPVSVWCESVVVDGKAMPRFAKQP